MNLIHAIRRPAGIALWLASVVLASLSAAAPAALATPRPRPPGWNKHPPVPASPRPGSMTVTPAKSQLPATMSCAPGSGQRRYDTTTNLIGVIQQ
jgi:hypothetical protein